MNGPTIIEALSNEKINRLRNEGLRSQELKQAGVSTSPDFTWIKHLFSRINSWVNADLFPRVTQARQRKCTEDLIPCESDWPV